MRGGKGEVFFRFVPVNSVKHFRSGGISYIIFLGGVQSPESRVQSPESRVQSRSSPESSPAFRICPSVAFIESYSMFTLDFLFVLTLLGVFLNECKN